MLLHFVSFSHQFRFVQYTKTNGQMTGSDWAEWKNIIVIFVCFYMMI
jgi:hypothetical protein